MNSSRTVYAIILAGWLLMLFGCGEKMPLPSVRPSVDSFGANDTSYIHLVPDWDAAVIGYQADLPMTPVDIAIGPDAYIFVADSANNRIITLNKSGRLVTRYNLNKIGPVEKPAAVAIDEKLNLLIVNGTNKVYVWNQYVNYAGLDPDKNPAGSDTLLGIHTFYTDADPASEFLGIAFGPEENNKIFLTDRRNNRILMLTLDIARGTHLQNGFFYPMFRGVYSSDIAQYGSGAGTVDNPLDIIVDDEGNIYFTQLGGNFLVQKLKPQGSQYISGYTLYEDPIMDLNRFLGPVDLALGLDDALFVIDRADSGRVSKFHNRGLRAGEPADLGNEGLVDARIAGAAGIAISEDETVYIANMHDHRIERYQYTVSENDLPDDRP